MMTGIWECSNVGEMRGSSNRTYPSARQNPLDLSAWGSSLEHSGRQESSQADVTRRFLWALQSPHCSEGAVLLLGCAGPGKCGGVVPQSLAPLFRSSWDMRRGRGFALQMSGQFHKLMLFIGLVSCSPRTGIPLLWNYLTSSSQ